MKRMKVTERQLKVLAMAAIIIALLAIVIWGMVPDKIYEVSEASERSSEFDGEVISVKGVVSAWDQQGNFTLQDSLDEALNLTVHYDGGLPDGFGDGQTVVVEGLFGSSVAGLFMEAQKLTIGCPSKY